MILHLQLRIFIVLRLEKRKRFLKRNTGFVISGELKRLTAKHLFMQQNKPNKQFPSSTGALKLGNSMWEEAEEEEKAEYTAMVRAEHLEDLKGELSSVN